MDHISHDLDPKQCCSVKNSSPVDALVELSTIGGRAYRCAGQSPASRLLVLDYSKAFDTVDHTILLRKLASTRVPGFLVNWFTAFFSGRQQCTKI